MESILIVALRDILCGTLSLDDGLSTILNISIARGRESNIVFETARAIEEIILRRPGVASAKLTELTVRLSFNENRVLPEMLALLDTRYTSSYRRLECEIIPDIEALPILLDILGEHSQAVDVALNLSLRPLLPFLADEMLMTLDAICMKDNLAVSTLAMRETHSLTNTMTRSGFFEGAELLLNRLMVLTDELDLEEFCFEVSLDEAAVLTELGLFQQARDILSELKMIAEAQMDSIGLASVTLVLSINETRDDSVDHIRARTLGDEAASMFQRVLDAGESTRDGLGLAHLVIGSSILANGWREAAPEAISRLEKSLAIFEIIENRSLTQSNLIFRVFAGLGFAHGLMGDHENVTRSIEYLERAKSILGDLEEAGIEIKSKLAECENALGWICLSTDSDEFWRIGLDAFGTAIGIREELLENGLLNEIELLGSRVGLALSQLRSPIHSENIVMETLRASLVAYFPLFPTDLRAYAEAAIATYNTVWLLVRHGERPTEGILRLLEDVDRMLVDARKQNDSLFIHGASLVVPYLSSAWPTLQSRAAQLVAEKTELSDVAHLMMSLALSKMNLEAISLEARVRTITTVDETTRKIDPLLAEYWTGQNSLAKALKAFYDNRDYSELATGLYAAAIVLSRVGSSKSTFEESAEFIRATSVSISKILMRFALALESQYDALVKRTGTGEFLNHPDAQFDFILAQDWLGLLKITDNYLGMVEQTEFSQGQRYLNAVFSNITRAIRMMDSTSMVDRRVLSFLGDAMNRRYYLRG